jgi:hypothetical protein
MKELPPCLYLFVWRLFDPAIEGRIRAATKTTRLNPRVKKIGKFVAPAIHAIDSHHFSRIFPNNTASMFPSSSVQTLGCDSQGELLPTEVGWF